MAIDVDDGQGHKHQASEKAEAAGIAAAQNLWEGDGNASQAFKGLSKEDRADALAITRELGKQTGHNPDSLKQDPDGVHVPGTMEGLQDFGNFIVDLGKKALHRADETVHVDETAAKQQQGQR